MEPNQTKPNMNMNNVIKTSLTSVILAGAISGSASATLVSHFSFDGDVKNSIASQADGTITGTAVYSAGKFGQTIALDAATDYVDLGSKTLGAIGTGNFTVSLWVNLNGNSVSGDPAFFSNKDWVNGGNTGINYAVSTLDGNSNGNLDVNTYGNERVDFQDGDTSDLSSSSWHNIILVRDGNELKYYFNGTQENGTKAITAGANFESLSNFILGDDGTGNYNSASNKWSADMLFDDLAIYDHALTTGEIATLQSSSAVPEPNSTALLGLGGLALILRRRK